MGSVRLEECLCCGSSKLRLVLDLGIQPPANSYTDNPDIVLPRYPLGLNVCVECWHSQLTVCVDRASIFDNYHYASRTSNTLVQYFRWFASALAGCVPMAGKVLELAANDGSFIRELRALDVDALGIDPASNIVETARRDGLPVVQGYWPAMAKDIEEKFHAIICMNVLAHVHHPGEFIAACKDKLLPGGFVLVQPSQARMFENIEFDTCYHEHLSFFNTSSISTLAEKQGLKLFGAFLVKIHGDSPVYVLGSPEFPPDIEQISRSFSTGAFAIGESLPEYERSIGLYEPITYERFGKTSRDILQSVTSVIELHREAGYQIAFVGAAAKAMTVIHAAGVRPDVVLDESPLKIGKFPPGINVRVTPLADLTRMNKRTLFVLTAWNFKEELIRKIRALGVPTDSRFYVYFPRAELIEA